MTPAVKRYRIRRFLRKLYRSDDYKKYPDDEIEWITANGKKIPLYNGVAVGPLSGKGVELSEAEHKPIGELREEQEEVKKRDSEYKSAVKRNDITSLFEMVKTAAEEAGYTTRAYHGTTDFGFTRIRTEKGKYVKAFFLTDNPYLAATYSDTFSKITNEPVIRDVSDKSESKNGIYKMYINTNGFLDVDAKGKRFYNIRFNKSEMSSDDIVKYALEQGYKGVIIRNLRDNGGVSKRHIGTPSTVYALFDPETQAKSGDYVVKDDNGDVIPISKRFDPKNSDIRY